MRKSLLCAALGATLLVQGAAAVAAEPEVRASGAVSALAGRYVPVAPARVVDTRVDGVQIGANRAVDVHLSERVPATTTAVVLSVTAIATTATATSVAAWPTDSARPGIADFHVAGGDTRTTLVTVAVNEDRKVTLHNRAGWVHLIADIHGYYDTERGALFTPRRTTRVADTRSTGGIGPNHQRGFALGGKVPANAKAVELNLTAFAGDHDTQFTVSPRVVRHAVPNLTLKARKSRAVRVVVPIDANGNVHVHNAAGTGNAILDVTGFYVDDYGSEFVPASPSRLLDTREGAPIAANSWRSAAAQDHTAVLLTVTGVGGAGVSGISVAPGEAGRNFGTSLINLASGERSSNTAVVEIIDGRVAFGSGTGSSHVIADATGYFLRPSADCAHGCVLSWGSNASGELGTGTGGTGVSGPRQVVGVRDAVAVAGRGTTGYALLADGTVRAWGHNGLGELGNGWVGDRSTVAVPVSGLTGVTAIAAGVGKGYALRADGTVWAWGAGSPTAASVPGLTGVVEITAGDALVARKADGSVWTVTGGVARRVLNIVDAVGIGAAESTYYAVLADRTAVAWGSNNSGQLGSGTLCAPGTACGSATPVPVRDLTGVRSVFGDEDTTFAVLADGTLRSWGYGGEGHGLGAVRGCARDICAVPGPVTLPRQVVAAGAHGRGGYAVLADGSVRAWGHDRFGAVTGTATGAWHAEPVRVAGIDGATRVAGGMTSGYALTR